MRAPFCKSFLTLTLFKVTEVYVSKSFLHEKEPTESGLTHSATRFTQTLSGLWSSVCIFRNEKWTSVGFVFFFWKKFLLQLHPSAFRSLLRSHTEWRGSAFVPVPELLVPSHAQPRRAVTHQDVCSLNSHSRFGPQA